jgi:hypothetical protein
VARIKKKVQEKALFRVQGRFFRERLPALSPCLLQLTACRRRLREKKFTSTTDCAGIGLTFARF